MANYKNYFSAAGLGLLFTLGFAPVSWWLISLFALAGLVYLIKSKAGDAKQAAWFGGIFAWMHHASGLFWIARSFYVDFGSWWIAAPLGVVAIGLLAAYLSLYVACVCYVSFKVRKRWFFPFIFTGMWVIAEYVRGQLPDVFPWNFTGYIWANELPLLQIAFVGEVYAMSAVAVLSAVLLSRRTWPFGIALVALCWVLGAMRLENAPHQPLDLNVSLVQANINQAEKWQQHKQYEHVSRYVSLSYPSDADLIIWPEMAILADVVNHTGWRHSLSRGLSAHQHLILGHYRMMQGETDVYALNHVSVIDGDKKVVAAFAKQHLIPYGEYIPFRDWIMPVIEPWLGRRVDYRPGNMNRVIDVPGIGAIYVLVCGEAAMPMLSDVQEARFILNMTNDSWFDGTPGPYQHAAMARVRAVAYGKTFVRVANTGWTGVFDKYGRIVDQLGMGESSVLNVHM